MLGEDHESGAWAYDPDTDPIVKMWCAAAILYTADACAAAAGKLQSDGGKALRDVRGQRLQLARICAPLGADVDTAALQVERAIDAQLNNPSRRSKKRTNVA